MASKGKLQQWIKSLDDSTKYVDNMPIKVKTYQKTVYFYLFKIKNGIKMLAKQKKQHF